MSALAFSFDPPAQPGAARVTQELTTFPRELATFAKSKGYDLALALSLLLVAWFFARWIRRAVIRGFARTQVDITLGKFFANMAKWLVLCFAIATCVGMLGIPTATFATIIGAAGLAIGLALQSNLSNLASGVLLLVFRPFKVGDSVIVAGQMGIIDGIDLFTTYLDTPDNRRIYVPNGAIFGGVIENQTYHNRRVVSVQVPVSGAISLDFSQKQLRAAADRVAASTPGVIRDMPPTVALAEAFPNVIWAVNLNVDTSAHGAVRQALLRELKLTLDEHALAPTPPMQIVRHVP